MRGDILERKEDIIKWINEKQSKAYICRELKCKEDTLNAWLKKMNINYIGNRGLKGIRVDPQKKDILEYANSSCVKSNILKKRLIDEGYKKHKCEECKLDKWNDELIPVELHHIDGDRFNNKFDNLQILCCNCHAQTHNWRGRGKVNKKTKKCLDCDNKIMKLSTRCKECNVKHRWPNGKKEIKIKDKNWRNNPKISQRKVDRPTLVQLKKDLEESNYSEVGRKYGVSDNSIRKWIKFYEKNIV